MTSESKSKIGFRLMVAALMVAAHSPILFMAVIYVQDLEYRDDAFTMVESRTPVVFGSLLEGAASDDVFIGTPLQAMTPECVAARTLRLLAPQLTYDEARVRNATISVNVVVDEELRALNWTRISIITGNLYGINVVLNETTGIPVLKRDPATYDLAEAGRSAGSEASTATPGAYGQIDTDRIAFMDSGGHLFAYGTKYQVVMFDAPDDEQEYTVIHELGHAFGLAHIKNSGQVMYATTEDGMQLGLHDCHRSILSHVHLMET